MSISVSIFRNIEHAITAGIIRNDDCDPMRLVRRCKSIINLHHIVVQVICVWGIWTALQGMQIYNSASYTNDSPLTTFPQRGTTSDVVTRSEEHTNITTFAVTKSHGRSSQQQQLSQLNLSNPDMLAVLTHFGKVRLESSAASGPTNALPVKYTKPYRPTITPYKRKYPRVLFFVHIHKSAGTLFCRLVHKNRVNTNHASNCNVQKDQYCCGGKDTLRAQMRFANETSFDLVATEREMYESMAPDYYDYIVMLRDSKSRYYSHYSHLRRLIPIGPGFQVGGFGDAAWIFGNNSILDRKLKRREIPEDEDPLGTFSEWYQGQPDNWNTRILCGAKCRPRPKYHITQELFQYTLERVNQFRHFLFVEDLESSFNQIAQAYNWYNFTHGAYAYAIENKSNRRKDKDGADHRLGKEAWDPFMSALDDALYEFARRKYHHIDDKALWAPFGNQAILDRYFAEGPALQCLDACCGNCTSY